jgi:hypothetical protein
MDEKRFYIEKEETKQIPLTCADVSALPARGLLSGALDGADETAAAAARRERSGQGAVCQGELVHGAHRQLGGVPEYQVPQTI